MDMKVLAAVLTTLAAVFVLMNASETGELGSTDFSGVLEGFLGPDNPEAETAIKADLKVLSQNTTMNVNGDLKIEGLKKYSSGDVDIESNNDIEFQNFEGSIFLGNQSKISGTAEGFTSNGVKVSKSFGLSKDLNTSLLTLRDARRVSLSFERADIDLQATNSSSSISETNTSVDITSFTGNISIRPGDMTLNLDGNISKVEAGQTSFR